MSWRKLKRLSWNENIPLSDKLDEEMYQKLYGFRVWQDIQNKYGDLWEELNDYFFSSIEARKMYKWLLSKGIEDSVSILDGEKLVERRYRLSWNENILEESYIGWLVKDNKTNDYTVVYKQKGNELVGLWMDTIEDALSAYKNRDWGLFKNNITKNDVTKITYIG